MLTVKILLMVLALAGTEGEWVRVRAEKEGISFLLPNAPQRLERTVNGIPSTIYQTKDLACVAGVVCSDLGAKQVEITGKLAQQLYEELKAGTLSEETAILKGESTVAYENMLIKEIEYSVIKDKHEMTYFKRIIIRENRIYQLTIGARNRHADILRKERETFFNSVAFSDAVKVPEKNINQITP